MYKPFCVIPGKKMKIIRNFLMVTGNFQRAKQAGGTKQ